MQKILEYAQTLVLSHAKSGDILVDATCGNGSDTLFLSGIAGSTGTVYAFDIQNTAITNTQKQLKEYQATNVKLILASHADMELYVEAEVAAVMFNLGYLPKGDKTVTTKGETTVEGVKAAFNLLKPGGIIVMVVYTGHAGGFEEKMMLETYLKTVNQKTAQVLMHRFINQIHDAPFLYAIEKL